MHNEIFSPINTYPLTPSIPIRQKTYRIIPTSFPLGMTRKEEAKG